MKLEWPTIIFMLAMHYLAIVALQPQYWSWGAIVVFFFLSVLTGCLGVTLGYHRLLSHRAFKTPRWLERFFATCGALSAEYGPIEWVTVHREHHKYSDTDLDPHDINKGFWWAHFGWMMVDVPALEDKSKLAPDLVRDPYYMWLHDYYLWLQLPLGLLLYSLGGWAFVLWGIPLRLVAVYHLTWCINSVAHTWGTQPLDSGDNSRNNPILGIIAFGEGWHNNHHAHPSSAKQGLQGQFDLTWYIILTLEKLGLAKNIRLPS